MRRLRAPSCQRARPVLLRQRACRDCAPSRELKAASLPLHPDHGGPRPLRLCLHAGGRLPGGGAWHASGDARVPAPPRHDPDGLRPSARRARAPLPRPAVPHHALRRPPAARPHASCWGSARTLRSRTCCAAGIRPRSRAIYLDTVSIACRRSPPWRGSTCPISARSCWRRRVAALGRLSRAPAPDAALPGPLPRLRRARGGAEVPPPAARLGAARPALRAARALFQPGR